MMRRFLSACLLLAAVGSSLHSGNNSRSVVEASAQSPDGPPPRQVEREKSWPDLAARVGPYGGVSTIGTARQATGEGFTLTFVDTTARDVLTTLRDGGAKYINGHFSTLISRACQAQLDAERAAGKPLACVISSAQQDAIVTEASAYLRQVQDDPGLAGFWLLDDYPYADVTSMLRRIRGLIQQSNAASGYVRPAICGVGGRLDFKSAAQDLEFTQDRRYTDQALSNVWPSTCDIVSPYFYGVAASDDPRLVDWSMRSLLPYFWRAIEAKGFDTSAQMILPIAHAFSYHATDSASYYVEPRAEDVAMQMHAYCEGGAFSIAFFTWQSLQADRSYANDESLREGVRQGRALCFQTWRH